MFKDLALLVQVVDFVVKACKAYALTKDGQKELQDIAEAEAAMSDNSGGVPSAFETVVSSSLDAAREALKNSKTP